MSDWKLDSRSEMVGFILGIISLGILLTLTNSEIVSKDRHLNMDACPAFKEMWEAREPYLKNTINDLQSENYRLRDICVDELLNCSQKDQVKK